MNMRLTPASTLHRLLKENQIQAAIEFCKKEIQHSPRPGYYAYWLNKLENNVIDKDGLSEFKSDKKSLDQKESFNLEIKFETLGERLKNSLTNYIYQFEKPIQTDNIKDLENFKKEIISQLPFKSEIYLPTSKIDINDQVIGLNRVKDLQLAENKLITKKKFEAIKKILQATGKRRIFIIGNGPSLKKTDLRLLENEITIGFNGIFLHDSFTPTIHIVEDHLVAEDRLTEITNYDCPIKIFPSYLAYCLPNQLNTIYLNHISRISYPVDTDFSDNAGEVTFTGGTVTYTGLQVAASLGFEEIILVGVDATYQVKDVEVSNKYGTGVLTSKSDDINHFNPEYFGKGYRWHDPNVHTMLQAYRKARNWAQNNQKRILNATIGGMLEVFNRSKYEDLFSRNNAYPRTAVLDFTHINRLSATGAVKKNLFLGWPKSSLLHTYADEKSNIKSFQNIDNDLYADGINEKTLLPALRSIMEFNPDILYIRPTHDRPLMTILQVIAICILEKPYVVHYMDDWLEKIKQTKGQSLYKAYVNLVQFLLSKSNHNLSICTKMNDYLISSFELSPLKTSPIHNYILDDLVDGIKAHPIKNNSSPTLLIRYFGGLEADMGLSTIIRVSSQIYAYNQRNDANKIKLEIFATPNAIQKNQINFDEHPSTQLIPQVENYDLYRALLKGSDINLLPYNFDESSINYVKYSLANKLPELIACGKPFIAIGDEKIATIDMLKKVDYPFILDKEDFEIADVIKFIQEDSKKYSAGYEKSLIDLRDEFSEVNNKYKFQQLLRLVSREQNLLQAECKLEAQKLCLDLINELQLEKNFPNLSCLVNFISWPSLDLIAIFNKVKSHGLDWSIKTESAYLGKELNKYSSVKDLNEDLKVRLIAAFICGLDSERFSKVNIAARDLLSI